MNAERFNPRKTKLVIGREYEIAPFGRDDVVKESISVARFVGYVTKAEGYPTQSTIKWPVFKTKHYGREILFALDGERCAARGENVTALMDDFAKMHEFQGEEHDSIRVGWIKPVYIPKTDFIVQMRNAGVTLDAIQDVLTLGRYSTKRVPAGDVSYCPKCEVMRATTRGQGCPCGNCTVCDYRWFCNPVSDSSLLPLGT